MNNVLSTTLNCSLLIYYYFYTMVTKYYLQQINSMLLNNPEMKAYVHCGNGLVKPERIDAQLFHILDNMVTINKDTRVPIELIKRIDLSV